MISTTELVLRLLLGALFGGLIGYERQVHGRPAGFRTHMLVCIASVLIMEVSGYFHFLAAQDPSYIRIDPGRIAAGAITGVGFLGAGVIVKSGVTVFGLTTAACLWMVSAIGLALGAGLYRASTAAFGLTLFALLVLRYVEKMTARTVFKFLNVSGGEDLDEENIEALLKERKASVSNVDYEKDSESGEVLLRYTITLSDTLPLRELVEKIAKERGVKKVVIRS